MARYGRKVRPGRKHKLDARRSMAAGSAGPTAWVDVVLDTSYRFWNRDLNGFTVQQYTDDLSCLSVWEDNAIKQNVELRCDSNTDKYDEMSRAVWLFTIPNITVLTAELFLSLHSWSAALGGFVGLSQYLGTTFNTSDWVLSNWLTNPDLLSATLLDPAGSYSQYDWLSFPLNPLGVALCAAETQVKLATRTTFDMANEEPTTWSSGAWEALLFMNQTDPGEHFPYLRLGY